MQKRIVEKYSDFLKSKIDPEVSRRILALNDDIEFKNRGIWMIKIDTEYSEPYNNFKIPIRINDYLKDLGTKRVFCLFEVKYSNIKTRRTDMPIFIGVLKNDDKTYKVQLFTNDWVNFHVGSLRTRMNYNSNFIEVKTIDDIIEKFKTILPLYDEELERQNIEAGKKKKEKEEKEERAKKFENKFTKQFILDEFSNVFDLCGEYEIGRILPSDPIYITLYPDKKEYISSSDGPSYMKMNSKIGDIFDELAATKDRLEEEGLNMEVSVNRVILIRLTEILPETTNEGIKDVFKKNPVDPEISKEILDLNNSERFKKNNITIEKLDLKPTGKFLFKYTDQAAIKNMISFKATLPEEIKDPYDDFGMSKKSKYFYVFIRQSRKTPIENGEEMYNIYIMKYIPKEIDWIFDFDDVAERGYLISRNQICQAISNQVCGSYENHLKEIKEKDQKEKHRKSFFEKFDEQYIKDIFADVLSLCPGEIKQVKTGEVRPSSNQGSIGGYYLLSIPLKAKKDTSAHRMGHVYDNLISEVFEELSVARDRLKDDDLIMSFNFSEGSLSKNPTLYIVVRDKIKQDEEDYIPEPAPDDYFP